MKVGRRAVGTDACAEELRFAELYEQHRSKIRAFCARRLPRDAVDDAVADTFLTVWRCLEDVPSGEASLVWLYRVAHRVVGHQRRSMSRRGRLHARLRVGETQTAHAADDALVDGVDSRRILAALARLSSTDAEVLRLVTWEELTVADAAAVLGIDAAAARQRLHRARRHLAGEYDRLTSRPGLAAVAANGEDR